MIKIRHIIELMINPFFIGLVLLGISVFFIWRRKKFRFIKIACTFIFVIFCLISTPWLPRFLSDYYENQYPVITEADSKINWIVVLGGGKSDRPNMPANASLSSASIKRLVEGIRLFKKLPDATLVLSGGSDNGNKSEAQLMNELALWFEVPKEKIILETKSLNTAHQAQELKSIVPEQPFYLVTSAGHMPRAMALLQQVGLHPLAAPTDFTFPTSNYVIPNPYNMALITTTMHEMLGQIWAGFRKETLSN